ncbi:hypothetical protein OBCHQ24_16325 [Oceanobacillus iheyensis]|nr:hypothetical protein OBCHQ24_16325 [Oceanobacillus iheyensis]
MKFTVIIPVFNSEDYLDECILSVINQAYKFQEHTQIVLINDGSTDRSKEICMNYKTKYPNSITYKEIKNSGPASARNTGIKMVNSDTEYITFLDADDKLDSNFFQVTSSFFHANTDVNIAVLPVFYFEKKSGPIKLNNRFIKGTRVINIFEEYNAPQFYIGGVVFKTSHIVDNNLLFDESMSFWEDALFVNQAILLHGKYGVISDTKYWYRQRIATDSLVDVSWKNKSRYNNLINVGYRKLISDSFVIYKEVIPYVQYLIIYHLKLFVFQKNSNTLLKVLNQQEIDNFIKSVKFLLQNMDDKYLLEQDTKNVHKEFLLYIKSGVAIKLNNSIFKIDPNSAIKFTDKKIKHGKLYLKGYLRDDNYLMRKEDRIFIKTKSRLIYASPIDIKKSLKIWDIEVRNYKYSGFVIQLPIWYFKFKFGIHNPQEGKHFLSEFNLYSVISKKLIGKFKK